MTCGKLKSCRSMCRNASCSINELFISMAFVYHDHEGFRPATRLKKRRRRPPPIQDLVLRAKEEVTANSDWLSECRGWLHLSRLERVMDDPILYPPRFDSRLCRARDPLQGDMPRFGELIGTVERSRSIGLPAARVATCFGCCESTFVLSVKIAGF